MKTASDFCLFINPYGGLPSEGWTPYRTFIAAQYLALQGINVLWLLSDFNHIKKSRRQIPSCFSESGVEIRCISTLFTYRENVTFSRLLFEIHYGLGVAKFLVTNHSRVKTIVFAEPALPYSLALVVLCTILRIPCVIDVLDLWPEHFRSTSLFKSPAVRCCYNLLWPLLLIQRKIIALLATRIITVSETYRKSYSACLSANGANKVSFIPIGVRLDEFQTSEHNSEALASSLPTLGAFLHTSNKVIVYSGSFGECYDLQNLTNSIRLCLSCRRDVRFLFIGAGPSRPFVQNLMLEYPDSVLVHSPVDHSMLPCIYSLCTIGICSYSKGSGVALPLKYFDYLAAGLAILSNLRSEIAFEIETFKVGLNYGFTPSGFVKSLEEMLSSESNLRLYQQNSLRLAKKYDHSFLYDSYLKAVVHHA